MSGESFQIPGLGQSGSGTSVPDLPVPASTAGDDAVATTDMTPPSETASETVAGDDQGDKPINEQGDKLADETARPAVQSRDESTDNVDVMVIDDNDNIASAGEVKKTAEENNGGDSAANASVTSALEAALDSMISATSDETAQAGDKGAGAEGAGAGAEDGGLPEWETDSNPAEDSSSDTSSDDDSDEDSDGDYPLLGIQETVRMLMAEDNDGDGDGEGNGPTRSGQGSGPLRTKNEVEDEAIPKPDVVITPDMELKLLGKIMSIVEKIVLIKSDTPGDERVIDFGSVLCKEDRTVIGALADVIGQVESPMYLMHLATEEDIKELGLVIGAPIFYPVAHANFVFTEEIKAIKGTDASNLHDEEVAPDEMEFSDDEKEAEYKKARKGAKQRGGRGGRDQTPQLPHNGNLDYDEEDGPYRPLTRPTDFAQGLPSSLPPRPEAGYHHRGSSRPVRADFRAGSRRGGGYRGGYSGHGGRGGPSNYDNGRVQQPSFNRPQGHTTAAGMQPGNPHLPPPPFGVGVVPPPPPMGHWAGPQATYPAQPVQYPHGTTQGQAANPANPATQQAPAAGYGFNYQQYYYGQAAQSQTSGQAVPPPHIANYPQGTWPVPPPPVAGAYVNPGFFTGQQQPGQQQQGGYGQPSE